MGGVIIEFITQNDIYIMSACSTIKSNIVKPCGIQSTGVRAIKVANFDDLATFPSAAYADGIINSTEFGTWTNSKAVDWFTWECGKNTLNFTTEVSVGDEPSFKSIKSTLTGKFIGKPVDSNDSSVPPTTVYLGKQAEDVLMANLVFAIQMNNGEIYFMGAYKGAECTAYNIDASAGGFSFTFEADESQYICAADQEGSSPLTWEDIEKTVAP